MRRMLTKEDVLEIVNDEGIGQWELLLEVSFNETPYYSEDFDWYNDKYNDIFIVQIIDYDGNEYAYSSLYVKDYFSFNNKFTISLSNFVIVVGEFIEMDTPGSFQIWGVSK